MTAPMNARTLKALRGSIAKWEGIVAGTGADLGVDNCDLCKQFYTPGMECTGCPVSDAVNMHRCIRTPYIEWAAHHHDTHRLAVAKVHPDCPECLRLAQAELDFLLSLLPSERP